MKKWIWILSGLLLSSVAHAHSGHGLESAYAGFMHPWTGIDHMLVMLAIGLWAAKTGGKMCWQLPMVFVLFMAVGAILGANLSVFSGLEGLIALTVMGMGVLLGIRFSLNQFAQFAIAATFALFHGLAHGIELQANAQWSGLFAMIFATALLHVVGLWFGTQRQQLFGRLQQGFALCMVLIGSYLLAA